MKNNAVRIACIIGVYFLIVYTGIITTVPHVAAQNAAPEGSYVPNQLIVQFRAGWGPHELENTLATTQGQDNSLMSLLSRWISQLIRDDAATQARIHLDNIYAADAESGATEKILIFDTASKHHTYLIMLDGTVPVEEAVEIYSTLHETVYAHPNYVYGIQ